MQPLFDEKIGEGKALEPGGLKFWDKVTRFFVFGSGEERLVRISEEYISSGAGRDCLDLIWKAQSDEDAQVRLDRISLAVLSQAVGQVLLEFCEMAVDAGGDEKNAGVPFFLLRFHEIQLLGGEADVLGQGVSEFGEVVGAVEGVEGTAEFSQLPFVPVLGSFLGFADSQYLLPDIFQPLVVAPVICLACSMVMVLKVVPSGKPAFLKISSRWAMRLST
jgi:hypothetical protein